MPDAVSIPALLNEIAAVPQAPTRNVPPSHVGDLTRRLAAGDESAFREFHALYFDRLYHFLLVVTRGQEHAARDALQDTLLRVARYAREFDVEDVFWSWLKAVARSAARDASRKSRRYVSLIEKFTFWRSAAHSPDVTRDVEDLRALIEEGLKELAPGDRDLIEKKYLAGATILEIAEDSGLTPKAVESRLGRLRQQLAALLLDKLRSR